MIRFQNVSKIYYNKHALSDISFQIDQGSFVLLVGPTGSGKTTIFRLIIRDLEPTEGEIQIGEINVHKLPKSKIRHLRRKVGVVFQDLKLLIDRTVGENVMLPLELSGVSGREARQRAEEVLEDVGILDKFNQFPLQLSGGERQRVAIARALIFKPEVILADEPTGNLDLNTSLQILELLEEINKRGTTIFMATHNDHIIDNNNYGLIEVNGGVVSKERKAVGRHEKKKTESQDGKSEKEGESHEKKEFKGKISLETLKAKDEK